MHLEANVDHRTSEAGNLDVNHVEFDNKTYAVFGSWQMNLTVEIVLIIFFSGLAAGILAGRSLANRNQVFSITGQHRQNKRYDQVVKVQIQSEDHKQGWFLELTESQLDRLHQLCCGAIAGRELSGAAWAGKGKLFSRGEWEGLVNLFHDREWVYWVNPDAHNRGLKLTGAGRAAFRYLAKTSHSPTPHHDSFIKGFDLAYTYRPAHTNPVSHRQL